MTNFWKSETYAIVSAMKATGTRSGVVQAFKDQMDLWASMNKGPDADAVRAWLPHWIVRPAYTAAELAPLWGPLAIAVGHASRLPSVPKSANRLANELKFAGLPWRNIDGKTYFIVERIHYWIVASEEAFREAL